MKKYLTLIILLTSLQTQAADRALVIGITEYNHQAKYNLPGIDIDVKMAQRIAQMLNFAPNQIKTLSGKQATAANIKQAISTWLVDGVTAQDRIFLYYSGHGGQFKDENNDEEDGNDEYITAYDLGYDIRDGGYVLDDEMAVLLNQIPSHYKILMFDSCHSGTTTRSIVPYSQILGGNQLYSKLHHFGKSPVRSNSYKNTSINSFIEGAKNTLVFAAAQDNESARADTQGSLFTIGMYQALEQATQLGASLKPQKLIKQAQQFITKVLTAKDNEDAIHHPVIFGDRNLLEKNLNIIPSRNGQGSNWQDLLKLANSGKPLTVTVNKSSFKLDEKIIFNLKIPTDGYLNVINVDAHDETIVLYPNKHNPTNQIKAGNRQIPGYLLDFDIVAAKPYGQSMTVFVLTTKPLNLYEQAINVRNTKGKFVERFAKLNQYSYESMRIRSRQHSSNPNNPVMYTTSIKTTVR